MQNNYGVNIVWEPGDGVRVLNPAEMLGYAETKTRQKFRQTGRALRLFDHVDNNRLDEMGQKRLTHMQVVRVRIGQALRDAQRDFSVPLAPIRSLPRRTETS
jgi:hypothetical protein